MKSVKEAYEIVCKIDKKYNHTGLIKQFTIDLIENFVEELNCYIIGVSKVSEEYTLGRLSYKAGNALEICNDALIDFCVIQELYDAINEKMKTLKTIQK